MLTIGDLDRRIVIQEGTYTQNNDYGGGTQSWADLITVWAKYFVKGGKIEDEADQQVSLSNAYFIIRDPKFTSPTFNEYDYRIKYDSKFYIIQNIRPVENRINDYFEIKTIEKDNTSA
jgi:SPP1 family predicted phage head-tail adaptor